MEHFIETVRKYPCLWNTTAIEYRDQELKDAAWTEVMKDTDSTSVKDVKIKWKKLRDSYRDALKRQSELLTKEQPPQNKRSYPWKYIGLMQFLQPYMNVRKKLAESPGHTVSSAPIDVANVTPHVTAHVTPLVTPHVTPHDTPHGAPNGDARSSSSSSSDGSSPRRRSGDRLAAIDRKLEYLCRASAAPAAPAAPVAPAAPAGKRPCLDGYHERKRSPPPPPALPDPLDIFFNGMCQTTKRFPYQTQVKIKKLLFNAVTEAEEALIVEQQSYASLWARGADSSSSSEAGDAAGGATGGAPGVSAGGAASGAAGDAPGGPAPAPA